MTSFNLSLLYAAMGVKEGGNTNKRKRGGEEEEEEKKTNKKDSIGKRGNYMDEEGKK